MLMKRILLPLVILCCGLHGTAVAQKRVLGADLSMLPVYEQAGAVYKDASGVAQADPLVFFRDAAGVRCVRLRLFVEPTGETGVVQDLNYVQTFARRIRQAGMKWMLDLHYSDTWADPDKQFIPRSWPTDAAGIEARIYAYTTEVLQALNAADAAPDYIQVGNEVSYGLCSMTATYAGGRWTKTAAPFAVDAYHDTHWDSFRAFLAAGAKACREQCPQARIVIHTERAGDWQTTHNFYQRLATLDYDIIGLSYYPFWHNSLTVLGATLTNLATTFPQKEVMVVEVAYNNAWYPTGEGVHDFQSLWPASPAGQEKFVTDLIAELRKHDNVTGLFYWMPEENPAGNNVYEPWLNRGLFANGNASVGQGNANCALPAFYALKKFTEGQEDGIREIGTRDSKDECATANRAAATSFDLGGRPTAAHHRGLAIVQGKKSIH